jgi:FAD/FMN-containing dehydrogenase
MADLRAAVTELAPSFAGRLLLPDDPAWDGARRVHNGLIDKRPALVAQCLSAADIADAVRLGRSQGLEIAVRGGGHNVGGMATVDGGLMIDLSPMRGVHVEPASRRAWVQGGATWKEVNRETQIHGLAVTGGVVGSTGVAGLTLGGGFGWLMPKHGMALDNLRSVELVTADGKILRVSAESEPDLFWAVRGGGGNFGVASSFEFALHPVGPMITGGIVAHPFSQARDVLRFYRDFTGAGLPDELFVVGALLTGPDGGKLVAIAAGHCGSQADAAKAVAPIKGFGKPALDILGPMPYCQLNGLLDGAFPKGGRNYWKSHFFDALDDDAIDAAIASFESVSSPMSQMLFENFHGAGTRPAPTDTAFALRSEGYNLLILSQWAEASGDAAGTAWARSTFAAMQPWAGTKRYLNYLIPDDAGEATMRAAYGPNLERLRAVKANYDPDNVFHLNLNIAPRKA